MSEDSLTQTKNVGKSSVDVTAMMQGVWDARDDRRISQVFAKRIWIAVGEVAYRGKTGRQVCDYDRLLIALSTVEPDHWSQLARLWEYLGKSLASGIGVAAGDETYYRAGTTRQTNIQKSTMGLVCANYVERAKGK